MTCKKCSYILYGSENYCPNCGEKCKETEIAANQSSEPEPKPIFISRNQAFEDVASKNRIFEAETAFEGSSPVSEERTHKKKRSLSGALTAFLSVICVLLFGTALFMAADYFGFLPVSDIISTEKLTSEGPSDTLKGEFASTFGTVSPNINYSPISCIVSSANSISLRKGPSDSYGQIFSLPSGCEVQVTGGSAENDSWVYVYVTKEDLYGWLNASFISGQLPEAEEKSTEKDKD